jgi:hypothetical protein
VRASKTVIEFYERSVHETNSSLFREIFQLWIKPCLTLSVCSVYYFLYVTQDRRVSIIIICIFLFVRLYIALWFTFSCRFTFLSFVFEHTLNVEGLCRPPTPLCHTRNSLCNFCGCVEILLVSFLPREWRYFATLLIIVSFRFMFPEWLFLNYPVSDIRHLNYYLLHPFLQPAIKLLFLEKTVKVKLPL